MFLNFYCILYILHIFFLCRLHSWSTFSAGSILKFLLICLVLGQFNILCSIQFQNSLLDDCNTFNKGNMFEEKEESKFKCYYTIPATSHLEQSSKEIQKTTNREKQLYFNQPNLSCKLTSRNHVNKFVFNHIFAELLIRNLSLSFLYFFYYLNKIPWKKECLFCKPKTRFASNMARLFFEVKDNLLRLNNQNLCFEEKCRLCFKHNSFKF